MFTIYDGRDHFYQWDIEQKLIVEDPTINEVHFCNRTDECSLVCDVYDEEGKRLVNVPNILLQTDWNINVYAYCENYTKHSDVFRVKKRSKPADYMYTETEVKTWDELEQRVINLEENGVPSETIGSAIEKYFEDNPIPSVDLTDYATIEYVDNSVNSVDLSDYATKEELSDKVSSTQLEEATAQFVTEADVDEKIEAIEIPEVDLSGYAKTEDIPDVSGFLNEEQVIALIEEHGGGGGALPSSEEAEF